jgi:UDP-N-acetylmuramoylalanine--D-glutamate ligase
MLNVSQQPTALQDVNYLVVGLGVSGYSVARYLMGNGYRCRIQDTREIPPFLSALNTQFDTVDFRAQPLDSDLIEWADVLVVSPGLSIQQAEIQQAIDIDKTVLGDIESSAQW